MQDKEMCIITEYIDRGSLYDVLHDKSVKLDWGIVLKMAIDAAKGITTHSCSLIINL
jgi:hypothetical protein